MSKIKVYLDDERQAPEGWVRTRWPKETIKLLQSGNVEELSLDHDLGNDKKGTGYDVLFWIEYAVQKENFQPPIIHIHTANPAARERMELAKQTILRLVSEAKHEEKGTS